MDSTSVMGSRFFLTGDLNLQSLNSIGVIYFNKKLAEDNGVGDLYGMVRSGEWTLDKFSECCRGVTADLDGDGLDADDRYGLTTNGFAWQPFLRRVRHDTYRKGQGRQLHLRLGQREERRDNHTCQ